MTDSEKVNGDKAIPSVTAMLGSLLSAVEKPTAENIAQRKAEDEARQRAIVVHSPHALMPFEEDAIKQMGRLPENYIGMAVLGTVQAQRMPTGQHVLILVMELPPDFFPALDAKAIVLADGTARTTKFDKQLALPITARIVCEVEALGDVNNLKANATLLRAHEGRTYGDLLDAGYVPPGTVVGGGAQ